MPTSGDLKFEDFFSRTNNSPPPSPPPRFHNQRQRFTSSVFSITTRRCYWKLERVFLNLFFVDQPKKLVAALGPDWPTGHSTIATHRQGIGSFDLPTITQRRVVELLLFIPTHKAIGPLASVPNLLRIAAAAMSSLLSKLLNLCLSTKSFPAAWKVAKVTPVF